MNHPQAWIETLSELRADGRPCALVVVTGVEGSGPRESGARMIVADGELVWGTIGGGRLELQAIEHAGELLKLKRALAETVAYPLSEKVGQCCGGEVTLFFETFPWSRRKIVVFGAGHVAQAIAGLHAYLQTDLVLIDSRDEPGIRPELPKQRSWQLLCVDHPEEELDALADDALVLVMTHDHALDLEIVAKAVKRDFAYVGLIGSDRKWERFQKRLAQRGFTAAQIAKVTCPIGVSKHSKEPTAIAISTAAELLDVLARTGTPR
ncbi:MAG: xanthine dehydrogenase accessory protein XdhC [Planctomycetes bacterium]|nr:xanthine dehydrogenase accessory protein XdhC [Planctomycetota bacterium]